VRNKISVIKQDPNKNLTYDQIISKLETLPKYSDLSKLKQTIQNYITDREYEAIVSSDKTVISDTVDREKEVIM